ncbi:major capsid protein [Planctellipticum variicoloris]|uniref:major capsid protein n=1 Tax=Planctellipticum variicoloris TaxID=3064265 RepID=UPI0030140A7E|nr:hypothetical protein SH412_002002 [Planctomycetaceae bacterium SH412]
MANEYLGLTELLQISDMNLADLNVTDLLQDAPLLAALAAGPASHATEHKYLKETGAPVVGFRAPNAGRENKKSADTLVTIVLKILAASFDCDKAIADAYPKGAQQWLGREAIRHLKAAFAGAEGQILYGVGSDADGFVGLADASTLNALADAMVVNAAGTTAATGSSVFLIRTNEDGNDCTLIAGKEGKIEVGDTVVIQKDDGTATGKSYPAYYTPIEGWLGLQIGSAYSVGRIANLTADPGKGLTDALIYEALSRFPASRQPNRIAMNRRSLEQLRKSRTATNATGAPAPIPTEVEGIPIVTTDQIKSTEALLT